MDYKKILGSVFWGHGPKHEAIMRSIPNPFLHNQRPVEREVVQAVGITNLGNRRALSFSSFLLRVMYKC